MKFKLVLFLSLIFLICQWQMSSCNPVQKKTSGEVAVRDFFIAKTDSLIEMLSQFDTAVLKGANINLVKEQFKNCRLSYKEIEPIAEYYFQGLIKRVNGPALPDVKTEDGQVWPPHGFQVIEQLVYDGSGSMDEISKEIKLLQTDLRFMRKNMEFNAISANHINEIIQHQFIRTAALGITGFDAPLSKLSLEEAISSLQSIETIISLYTGKAPEEKKESLYKNTISYLRSNNEFDSFNRLEFLTEYLMPLSELYLVTGVDATSDSLMVMPFKGTLNGFMKGNGFNADFYAAYATAGSNTNKIALGQKLFFDKSLSASGSISCGTCHKPELYFTDGKAKAGDFVHGGTLLRNTPSLYYAGLQSHQFYDLRSITLEDQADQVMRNSKEFNFNSAGIAAKLESDSIYAQLFRKAFDITNDTLNGFHVRNALAAFVRSLSPFSSPFDEYMQGNKNALNKEQVVGFNLFTGKGKCATCHFIPLFNGNIPPWLTKSESEIIGVPSKPVWKNATIDIDSGRYKINQMQELLFAFKTPGIRNIDKTAPYMHNGVYRTLDEVVEFYHKGGGVGIGINLPFQSLPFDSLSLNVKEKRAIVSFMKSLTDKKITYQ